MVSAGFPRMQGVILEPRINGSGTVTVQACIHPGEIIVDIQYQFTVGIESVKNMNFVSGRAKKAGTLSTLEEWLESWERWVVVNYADDSATAAIKFGDIVSFKNSNFSTYLSAKSASNSSTTSTTSDDDNINVNTQPNMQDTERWVLINPYNPTSTDVITTLDPFYLQHIDSKLFAESPATGEQQAIPLLADRIPELCIFRMIVVGS